MDVIEILKQDYQRFPNNQTYTIYSDNVYFKDPLNEFQGIQRYQKMIHFLNNFFRNIQMDLHSIRREGDTIHTNWTLHLTPPLPWKPRLSIPGSSELKLNDNDQITAHIDVWHISRLDVLKQNFSA